MTSDSTDLPSATDAAVADGMPRFVHVKERRDNGIVLFDFAIGWPDLAVELAMPEALFEAFCARHQAKLVEVSLGDSMGTQDDID